MRPARKSASAWRGCLKGAADLLGEGDSDFLSRGPASVSRSSTLSGTTTPDTFSLMRIAWRTLACGHTHAGRRRECLTVTEQGLGLACGNLELGDD